ncbi:hypothetical protein CXG81DRAFT_27244 [Caulochytrium protostelioides]|uniref:Inositol polyphosphate-related phosphatase domain-containing protein n=1 Tax=Caulochytrium protostelioides TaxID=1555241 RepID=A0A4V1IUC0_9FUNG|nr:hypothetical protein CXG81DRAFT_27244 [Caulochytrium protostelioides]|eukprot:RKP00029.1 hypothetical protein CXG81DRAFT_27244 [Caulochytrium protostelioides]
MASASAPIRLLVGTFNVGTKALTWTASTAAASAAAAPAAAPTSTASSRSPSPTPSASPTRPLLAADAAPTPLPPLPPSTPTAAAAAAAAPATRPRFGDEVLPPLEPWLSIASEAASAARDPARHAPPHLVVLALQEVMTQGAALGPWVLRREQAVGPGAVAAQTRHRLHPWGAVVAAALHALWPGTVFRAAVSQRMVTMGLLVFVRDGAVAFSRLTLGALGSGMLGTYGNKGAVAVGLEHLVALPDGVDGVDDVGRGDGAVGAPAAASEPDTAGVHLCFVGAHLHAHEGDRYRRWRHDQVQDILHHLVLEPVPLDGLEDLRRPPPRADVSTGAQRILDYDLVVLSGDLNYRLDPGRVAMAPAPAAMAPLTDASIRERILRAVAADAVPWLLSWDELLQTMRSAPSPARKPPALAAAPRPAGDEADTATAHASASDGASETSGERSPLLGAPAPAPAPRAPSAVAWSRRLGAWLAALAGRRGPLLAAGALEAPIRFLPTYKFSTHADDYTRRVYSPKRLPAYCDRILVLAPADLDPDGRAGGPPAPLAAGYLPRDAVADAVVLKQYGADHGLHWSDHKPLALRMVIAPARLGRAVRQARGRGVPGAGRPLPPLAASHRALIAATRWMRWLRWTLPHVVLLAILAAAAAAAAAAAVDAVDARHAPSLALPPRPPPRPPPPPERSGHLSPSRGVYPSWVRRRQLWPPPPPPRQGVRQIVGHGPIQGFPASETAPVVTTAAGRLDGSPSFE